VQPALISSCSTANIVALNPRNIEDLVRACIVAEVAAYVRVPDPHNATDIRRALEAGAEGIFLPEIRSIDDIDAAAQAAFFPPQGDRGICPSVDVYPAEGL
jgi:2-keto-3-deoxy-L-rhamnonate aldolase RhmA